MSNITVSIDEQTYRAARIVAAQRNSTVSALVRDYLNTLINESTQPDARKNALFEALDKAGSFKAGERLSRSESHRR
jgi:Family of unknown function (DUF6364)